ncbi:hypothetical protein CAEBREN_22157 [Caenorhabditis brenneri]|uniref:Uncharacterized protein n=1 Tax=Caenorhabditis brenneri TaxID=135651 RepID=G0MA56_CAEBE|nr:hypothetical protein CAEBREN_22157 [Caenorhabditis brenneri]
MTVTIIITEEMIQCFNQCARLFESRDIAGNYRKPDGRCLPEYFIPTPILTHEKNVCKVKPVQKEKLKKLDTTSTEPDVAAIEASGTGQFSKSAGPTSTSLNSANLAATAVDIMNSVTDTQVKNEQMISLFESELDPEKSDRMKMRELKNMIKDLKNQVEQKLTEQTTQIQNLEKSFKDQVAELTLALSLKEEQSNEKMNELMDMMTLMMQNSSAAQASDVQVDPVQNMVPDPSTSRAQESSSGTSPIEKRKQKESYGLGS